MKTRIVMFKQLAKYSLAAISAAGGDWIAFILLHQLTGHVLLAQGVARLCGGAISFIINKKYSFKSADTPKSREALRFIALYAVSYALSLVLVSAGANLFAEHIYYVKLTIDTALFVFNFLIMKFLVFNHGAGSRPEKTDGHLGKAATNPGSS
jgi:putative flippase GtrA